MTGESCRFDCPSFDHLIGADEQSGRNLKSEELGSLDIDDQLEIGWLLDRDVAGFMPRRILSI
jgi:hypothetical protein